MEDKNWLIKDVCYFDEYDRITILDKYEYKDSSMLDFSKVDISFEKFLKILEKNNGKFSSISELINDESFLYASFVILNNNGETKCYLDVVNMPIESISLLMESSLTSSGGKIVILRLYKKLKFCSEVFNKLTDDEKLLFELYK